mgnify:CR=1 FL=1
MFQQVPRGRERLSWLLAAAWTLIIYATIPLARTIQEYVSAHWGRLLFRDVVFSFVVLAAGGGALVVVRSVRSRSWSQYVWLAAVAAGYVFGTLQLWGSPEEALHFIEYGVLALLLFHAFSYRMRDPLIYVAAALAGAILGSFDEIIQWLTPRRFFDFRDIGLNTTAGVLMVVGISRGLRPPFICGPVPARSVRLVCGIAAVQVAVLVACLMNTPRAVERYASRLPRLEYLRQKPNVMSEYGYRHVDPDIGVFYSRFNLADLEWMDKVRAKDAAAILDRYRNPKKYEAFLKRYTPASDPFVHEARVHLFRRDHYMAVAWKYKADEQVYRYHLTVALRENQIMEKYFGRTLRKSKYVLGDESVKELKRNLLPDHAYESGVSAGLITRFNRKEAAAGGFVLFVVLGWTAVYHGRWRPVNAGGDKHADA